MVRSVLGRGGTWLTVKALLRCIYVVKGWGGLGKLQKQNRAFQPQKQGCAVHLLDILRLSLQPGQHRLKLGAAGRRQRRAVALLFHQQPLGYAAVLRQQVISTVGSAHHIVFNGTPANRRQQRNGAERGGNGGAWRIWKQEGAVLYPSVIENLLLKSSSFSTVYLQPVPRICPHALYNGVLSSVKPNPQIVPDAARIDREETAVHGAVRDVRADFHLCGLRGERRKATG